MDNGNVSLYHGNYTDYLYRKTNASPPSSQAPAESSDLTRNAGTRELDRERKRQEGELRNRFYRETKSLQNRIRDIERESEKKERRLKEIEAILEQPATCADRALFNRMLNEYESLKRAAAVLNEEWMARSLELEEKRKTVFGEMGEET